MRAISRVHKGYLCAAFVATFVAVGVVFSFPADHANAASSGESSYASKADGMVSTIEGFIRVEDFVSAEKAAAELTATYPDFQRGWIMLGYTRSRNGKFLESNEAYDKALEYGADEKTVLMRKAYNFVRAGEYETAGKCYRDVITLDSRDAEAMKQLAYLEGKLGNYDQASFYYRQVLKQDPNNAEVLEALAKIEAKRGGSSEVEELLKKTLELEPYNTTALSKLGVMYIKDKKFKEAVEPLTKLVELKPEDASAHRNLGIAHYQLKDKSKACEQFSMVQELGGDMKGIYGPLADCLVQSGKHGEAMAVIKAGIAAEEQEAWLYCMWGKILEKGENYDGAIGKFAKAADMQDEPWSTYARKQIARQSQLKQRADLISSQGR